MRDGSAVARLSHTTIEMMCLWIRGDSGSILAAETVIWMYSKGTVRDMTESRPSGQPSVHGPHSTLRNSIVSYGAIERMREGARKSGLIVPHNKRTFASDISTRERHRVSWSVVTRAVLIVGGAVCSSCPAVAYRPFDGTDAAVAELGEVEIELQPAGLFHSESRNNLAGPYAVYNYGFADRWELVLQGAGQATPADVGPSSVPNAALLKYVLQPGVLQEKVGPSIATEFGLLLPDLGQSGLGFSWSGIMSQRWQWGTVHLNIETNLTPDQHGELFLDAILEGPSKWTVRPVLEVYTDSVFGQSQTLSALIGAIWQVRDTLAFDVGLRHALVNGQPVNEVRAGVTFGFPVDLGRPAGEQQSNAMFAGRR
jgi:hypothetical protein